MTKYTETTRCRWCGRALSVSESRGRPRLYCRQSCRQRAYELRRRQGEGKLRPGEVPISEDDFETLRDGVYALNAALDDVDADVRETGDYKAAFLHLRRAASALRGVEVTVASG